MSETLQWDAPGSGSWDGDLTYKLTSFTRPMQELFAPAFEAGFRDMAARYGLPLETIRPAYVNGYAYAEARPVGAPEKDRGRGGPPPALVLKVLSRLHPELRRRTVRAREAFEQQQWRADIARWRNETMPARVARNRELQAVDPATLDDAALAEHVRVCAEEAGRGLRHHFSMVGAVLAVGDLLAAAERSGLDAPSAIALLTGSSPASAEGRDRLGRIAAALGEERSATVRTLDDIRAASDVAAKELDELLDTYGHRLVGASDLDGRTLVELPSVVVRAIRSEAARPDRPEGAAPEVPPGLTDRLAEARVAYGAREEEVGVSVSWTMGLLRRALLVAGERLVAHGACAAPDDVFDLGLDETRSLLVGGAGPSPEEIAGRRRFRRLVDGAEPPPFLGTPPSPPPPSHLFPAPMARAMEAMGAYRAHMVAARGAAPLRGLGVGTEVVRGTACVAATAEEALDRLQPGQVLITSITTPAFNAILPLAGALVTQEGGLLSHPAIAARELGLTAVVGAPRVLTIPDGADVIVDPAAGLVTVEVQP